MKFKKILPLAFLLLAILTISAAGASEEISTDNLTYADESIPDADANLSASIQEDEQVLESGIAEEDIKIQANTKAINLSNGNEVIVTVKVPKGANGEIDLSMDNIAGLDKKFAKLTDKKTKNGVTTYTIHLKDFTDYNKNIANDLKTTGKCSIAVFCHNKNGEDTVVTEDYIAKVDKKTKTLKLKRLIPTNVWIGPFDMKSGTSKKLTAHLVTYPGGKAVSGKKVKITINGVTYSKKTNSKGLVYIYPPKHLPPASFCKVHMKFAGDGTYAACSQTNDIEVYKNPGSSKSKITANSKTFSANKTKKYTVKLTSNGKAIKKAKVKLTVNGKQYSAKTNSKGQATFDLSKLAKKGNFKATLVYMGDNKHYMTYKSVKIIVK